ncbi:hypothetical protein [Pyxidicoccus caerfyrddinensis]|uniref:hypothetical protein n=1 Tax=Pyxidicoccus caerfyrddinensis TaxID=2709663 RepID=UPI0013DCA67C|nr:hypothetical protein [Pyxidicoccus caerfyrddinensis]
MKTFVLVLAASMSLAFFATACGDDECTAEESSACTNKHTLCVAACGTGEEPGYGACVQSCTAKLCDCHEACGTNCDADID